MSPTRTPEPLKMSTAIASKLVILYCLFALFAVARSGGESINAKGGGVDDDELKFESSAKLCEERCKCLLDANILYIDCVHVNMLNTIAEWPQQVENATRIVAKFDGNHIAKLKPLPSTDLDLMLFYVNAQIEQLEPGLFVNTPKLTNLDLSYNKITSDQLTGDVFKGQYNNEVYEPLQVSYLNLAGNNLHKIPKNAFEHLVNLQWLDLSDNDFMLIDVITQKSFQHLGKLEHLSLAQNNLQHLNNTVLHDLQSLRVLDLSNNQLHFVPGCIKHVATTLVTLKLDSNPIVEITANDFIGMDQLVDLSLSHLNAIVEIKMGAFNVSKQLKRINLSYLNRNCLIPDGVFGENLKELDMSFSGLKVLSPRWLNYSHLTHLDVSGNQLICTCDMYKVAHALPEHVKRTKDGPYCSDQKRYKRFEVYTLNESICCDSISQYLSWAKSYHPATDARIIRMSLLSSCIILFICACVATWLGYTKCTSRPYRSYPFTTSVVYNPITSISHYDR